MRSNKKGYMAIKLDIEKAYDRLEWNFIKKCFADLGFCRWIRWTVERITTTTFTVLINGKPGTPFHLEIGTR